MSLSTYNPILSTNYAVAKSSSDKIQDYIYARAKTFNGDGSFMPEMTNAEIRYAIIALKDWEQVAVRDNTDVLYTTVPPETRHLFDFNLPDVERENNFQLIAFPFPYEVNADNYESQQTFGSFRVVIQNKE
ncbi:hypothetical protein LQF35_17115 [Peribacillus sp. N3]|nr:hypothetical protein [Peribacillus castrilensis]